MDSLIKGLKLPTDDFGIEPESSYLIPTDNAGDYTLSYKHSLHALILLNSYILYNSTSSLKCPKNDSIGALSQQFPLRDID